MPANLRQAVRTSVGILIGLVAVALPLRPVLAANVFTNAWSLELLTYSDSAPAVAADGTIYFGAFDGRLWAVRPDGVKKWTFRTGAEIRSSPAVGADGVVHFGSRDCKLYAVGADGRERWSFKAGGWVDTSPALARDGSVYFGSWDKSLYAVDASGRKKWQFTTGGEVTSSPAIGSDGTVYFGSHDKRFYALAVDGQKRWEFETGGVILSSPAIGSDGELYFTSMDGFLYALNADGALRWRLKTCGNTESSPVIAEDGTIYVGVLAHLWAVSADGKKLWGRTGDNEYSFDPTPMVLSNGSICFANNYGMLSYASPVDGRIEYMYYLHNYGYGSPAIGRSGDIYAPDRGVPGGGFSAFRAGAALARSPWPRFHGNARNTGNILDSVAADER